MQFTSIVALAAAAGAAEAAIQGFNCGAFFLNQQAKVQADFTYEFKRARDLPGTSGWNSARLYSMIQWGTTSDVIQAIPAAIETKTTLLLGLWVSGSEQAIDNELSALTKAVKTYGKSFTDLIVGISVGSEDLYRDSIGQVGVTATALVNYIERARATLADLGLSSVPLGHVDTYDAFVNNTNAAVPELIDWLGYDGYPFFDEALPNAIDNAHECFYQKLDKMVALANGKPVWVTETGWPVSGDQIGQAVASLENAQAYWKDVACSLIASNTNVWWYILQESQYGTAKPDFGLFPSGDLMSVSPNYDLSC